VYPGWYLVNGCSSSAASATNQRALRWAVNGTAVNYGNTFINPTSAGGILVPSIGQLLFLNVGDYVELQAYQNSGGALNTSVGAGNQPVASILWESNS
jgi:hypothetical protein